MQYFEAIRPTPILSTPDFSKVFGSALPFDSKGLLREVEMIALPGMVFHVVQEMEHDILQVGTPRYPCSPLYLNKRAGRLTDQQEERPKVLPSIETILERMKKMVGLPYIWGGNWSSAIPEWKEWYPPKNKLSVLEETHWTFKGVDCSGLLYESTDGFTPRNTSELMDFGIEVMFDDVKPLDMILYKGHVIIALSEDEVIESNHTYGGVRISPLKKRIAEIAVPFTFRRFHPDAFQTL